MLIISRMNSKKWKGSLKVSLRNLNLNTVNYCVIVLRTKKVKAKPGSKYLIWP